MKNKIHFLLTGALMLALLIGCKAKSTSDLNADVATFVSNSNEVVGYGYIDFNAIMDKSELTQKPEIGSFINEQLSEIKSGLNLSDKIHYALEGPLDKNGTPKYTYVFMSIKDKDSLKNMFEEMGFFFEKENDLMVFYDMNMAIGFNDNTAVMIAGEFGDEATGLLANTFASFKLKEKDERVTEVLAMKTDILIASNLENLYKTSNTSLQNLSQKQQEEIEEMVEDGHLVFSLDFNNGDLTAKLDISKVNEELKEAYFFKSKGASEINKNIGPGEPFIAMALSLDIDKLEELMSRFSPDSEKSLFRSFGLQGLMMDTALGDDLSDIMNGNIGFMISDKLSDNDVMGMGSIPGINVYLGLGKDNQNMLDLLETFSEEETIQDLGDDYYRYEQSMMLLKDNAVIIHSNDSLKQDFKVEPIQTASVMPDFGNKPLSLFIDLKKFADSELNMTGGQYDMLFGLSDHLTITGDNNEFVLKLVLKDKKENILKQLVDAFEDDLKNQVGNISF